jgi:TatD DNase family protein
MFVDSHAHLQWASFDPDRDAVIRRAKKAGVANIVNIEFDIAGSRQGVELTARHAGLCASMGCKPRWRW